jgi:hypothetical protein
MSYMFASSALVLRLHCHCAACRHSAAAAARRHTMPCSHPALVRLWPLALGVAALLSHHFLKNCLLCALSTLITITITHLSARSWPALNATLTSLLTRLRPLTLTHTHRNLYEPSMRQAKGKKRPTNVKSTSGRGRGRVGSAGKQRKRAGEGGRHGGGYWTSRPRSAAGAERRHQDNVIHNIPMYPI